MILVPTYTFFVRLAAVYMFYVLVLVGHQRCQNKNSHVKTCTIKKFITFFFQAQINPECYFSCL